MRTLAEIEKAISKLPPAEFRQLLHRLNEREAEAWDRQIEADAASGKLDHLWEQAKREIAAGEVVPLDEFLDGSKLSQALAGGSAGDSPVGTREFRIRSQQAEKPHKM